MTQKNASVLAIGAGLHLASNALMKVIKSTSKGHAAEAAIMAKGIRNGLKGRDLGYASRQLATFGIGPESVVPHDLGAAIGKAIRGKSPSRQRAILKKMRKAIASSEDMRSAPNGMSSIGAISRVLSGTKSIADKVPSQMIGSKPNIGQRILAPAIGASAVAVDPHFAVHFGVNAARNAIGKSATGKKILSDQLIHGLNGKKINRAAELATDLIVSPGALDTRRMGLAMRSAANERGVKIPYLDRSKIDDLVSRFSSTQRR